MGFFRKEQITFFLTTNCNLNCRYCYMPKLQAHVAIQQIDPEFAAVGLRDFFTSSSSRKIRFFAPGEPSMAYPIMQRIWQDAKTLAGNELRTELETNGYFGKNVAEWITRHVDYLWISCDGPPELQNSQRPTVDDRPSSFLVHENLRKLSKSSRTQVGVRATIEALWLDRQVELVEFFHHLGVKYLAASPCYYSSQNPKIVTPSLLRFAEGFVPAYFKARELGMWYLTLMIVNFDEPVEIYCQASIPAPRLTTDGFVSCCDWAPFGNRTSIGPNGSELIYGRYDKGKKLIIYDVDKMARIRMRCASYLSQHYCNGCPALHHCAGGCVGKMMAATGDLYRPSEDWCQAVRYLFGRLPIGQGLFPVLHP